MLRAQQPQEKDYSGVYNSSGSTCCMFSSNKEKLDVKKEFDTAFDNIQHREMKVTDQKRVRSSSETVSCHNPTTVSKYYCGDEKAKIADVQQNPNIAFV